MKKRRRLTYKSAGVDIDEGDRFVRLISPLAKMTFRPEVITELGSFSGLFRLNRRKYRSPVLVSGTDGVGTKLKIAFLVDCHDTVGIDLVAMCINDILTCGAEPLFFLDYFATGKLKPDKAAEVVKGIAQGCRESGCALLGGETAEMPGFYKAGEYDLSGFAVGVVEEKEIIDGSSIKKGDVIIGLSSSGLHSNGFSLVRKIVFEKKKTSLRTILDHSGTKLGEELLKPTRIYVEAFNAVRKKVRIKGMAHITGGGLAGNVSRVIPAGLRADISFYSWPVQRIFRVLQEWGNVPEEDMQKTFNMGIGYVMVVSRKDQEIVRAILHRRGFDAYQIGYIAKAE